ncbi:hypothetical protein SS50377_28341 [Spironucleus salmonicida]|uniref:Uncharacterized protein n=1 Tax=Spironucleus salmonicida TaxID=348837 RepID=A0A9P8LLI4_9EUKA|nr:hypothetical protein SS50377_28341 [Spironucleus salmonicida]
MTNIQIQKIIAKMLIRTKFQKKTLVYQQQEISFSIIQQNYIRPQTSLPNLLASNIFPKGIINLTSETRILTSTQTHRSQQNQSKVYNGRRIGYIRQIIQSIFNSKYIKLLECRPSTKLSKLNGNYKVDFIKFYQVIDHNKKSSNGILRLVQPVNYISIIQRLESQLFCNKQQCEKIDG